MNSKNSKILEGMTVEQNVAREGRLSLDALEATKRENARLRLALRELRHRSCNQWQFLTGLAELERTQLSQSAMLGYSLRLLTVLNAFAILNRTLDADTDIPADDQKFPVRPALEGVMELMQSTSEKDRLHFSVQDAWLSEKGGIALMLICAELVCNAIKYGRGTIQVDFRAHAGLGTLEVHDNGPGFPSGFRIQEQERQGLQLVDALCRFDLNGEMSCRSDVRGGIVSLSFPVLTTPEADRIVGVSQDFCTMEGVICFDSFPD